MTEHNGRTFDYVPRLDPRNLAYRVGSLGPSASVDLPYESRYWVPGPVLDQGREGACVGFGCTAEAMASPVRWKGYVLGDGADYTARSVYRRAQQIDEWEGESYEGTSVRAGMLVGRERGWWEGFRWALSMTELRAALELGPVVIGVEWLSGMYRAPGGIVTVDGQVVGGHCLLLTGYTPRHRVLKAPAYRWRNSWSVAYGARGSAFVKADDLDRILFRAGGEAAVPVGRAA